LEGAGQHDAAHALGSGCLDTRAKGLSIKPVRQVSMTVERAPGGCEADDVDTDEQSLSIAFIPQVPHTRFPLESRR
jgi:hypothetical protein